MANKQAYGSKLTHLLSTHDFKLVCADCSVKENEITYLLKSASHQCARNTLIGKAKASDKWRPISRRPAFPNPNLYEVCWYFSEGSGCKKHKNRCTFARSDEEATAWNFEKCQGLNHTSFCQLIAQTEIVAAELNTGKLDKPETLSDLLAVLDVTAACSLCSVQEKEITVSLQSVSHCCGKDLLLAKAKGSNLWRPVSPRPSLKSKSTLYQVCIYFEEGSGCTKHGRKCTFARSMEEATVWNFENDRGIDTAELIRLVTESEKNASQPQILAENILKEFSGEFLEFCQYCFLGSPPKMTVRSSNSTCSSNAIHAWNPVLVHHVTHSQGKEVYSQVRPLPPNCRYEYCSHVQRGMPCWHGPSQCHCAHSEVELAVWKAEESGPLVRAELLLLSQDRKAEPGQVSIYCKACLLVLSSQESFLKHCASLEHAQMISDDTAIKWGCRPPPHCSRERFSICDRPATCEYGNSCLKAHSVEELEEWLMRANEQQEIRLNIEAQGFMPYGEKLLEEYRNSSNEVYVMSDQVDDVSVMCDEELYVDCEQADASLHWNFHVNTERLLVHVALLKQEPGASFSLGEISSMPCTYASGEQFRKADMTYDITVSFEALNPGLYEQWLVLDFDMRPVLLQKLKVRVGKPTPDGIKEPPVNRGTSSQSLERWHRGNRVIIPCINRREDQEELLKEYKPPQISFLYKPANSNQTPLNHENYKERMHHFLYDEERAEEEVVSRLNFCGEAIISDTLQDMKALHGELYCTVSVTCKLTPDTPEGSVLRRSVQSALIATMSSAGNKSKVYEAIVVRDTMTENKMHLLLSKRCCSELDLRNNETRQMEVQFQLNRLWYCKMHKAVDRLPDTERVLPDLKRCGVPVNDTSCDKVNAKQQAAINFITGDSDVGKGVAPLLIYGPFGTGKTFTLATAARELSQQPDVRVLICTHTNSSADLYVKDHFHPFIKHGHHGVKPIRIKAKNYGNSLNATDAVTLKYCHLSKDGQYFLPPTKSVLDRHRIVITTTSMAQHFHDLKLPSGYFTHILIDEASQMLECEALIPLGLAGPNTRVVLAGDHMQMGPKLFSVEDHQRSNHTLLNRLFHFYQSQTSDAATNSRIIFNANYRSTKEIVDFVSTQFYVGKNDAIKAVGKVPVHPDGHSLKFYHVRGECHMDIDSMSWYNNAEVVKVVEIVQDIVEHWPSVWGNKDHSSICVLSEGCQVRQIRKELWKRHLVGVKVENIANVQGKQFRAVIITAVQTRESLTSSHLPGVELFNDPRVLNTAMTRAQSQVFVVGDAAALCTFGKCSRIWKNYIDHCMNKESVEPNHLTKDFFEKEINEISRFQRIEQPDDSSFHTDAILQQLEDDIATMEAEYSSDKFEPLKKDEPTYNIKYAEKDNLRELSISQPNMYVRGRLVMESFDTGYVIPFDNPTKRVSLKGRQNLGKTFHGDEVVLQRQFCDGITQNKVLGVTKMAESSRVFVCTLEDEDHCKRRKSPEEKFIRKMMIPLARNAPKLCILVSKKDHNLIPVWDHSDTHWIWNNKSVRVEHKQSHVFVVEVVCWNEKCLFPLGRVIDVLPIGTLEDGLRILDAEFRVESATEYSEGEDPRSETEWSHTCTGREDLHKVKTFTVDPEKSKVLDDAISVKEFDDDHYEIGVHITDVASFVSPGDALDREAKRCGTTYYRPGTEPISLFPESFSSECSLLPGRNRSVISLIIKAKKATDEIVGEPTFQLSLINSDRQLSYDVAEDIIKERSGREPKFDTVEDCVAVAYRFAKAQRRARLKDWAYARPDDHRLPGKRRAHLMIEELSVLFNRWTSHVLIHALETRNCTPLRCQAPPIPEKVEELKEMYGHLIPLSFHLKHRVLDCDQEFPGEEGFRVLTKVWHEIQSAAQTENDQDKLIDLIATDDIHPQLLPAVSQFRKCFGKSYIIRSHSSPKADVGHCLMKLRSYTQASSPLRRFIDIILQRLLHTQLCGAPVQYSTGEIDMLCQHSEESIKTAKQYEQKAEMISFAVSMKKQNVSKVAFVVSADAEQESFRVSFPFDKGIFPDSLPVMYRDLQLEEQPSHETNVTTLKWRRRIYSASKSTIKQIHDEVKRLQNHSPCTEIPLSTWKAILEAIDKENWDRARSLIQSADTKQEEQLGVVEKLNFETCLCSSEEEHYVDLAVELMPGDTIQVQMTSEIKRGQPTPTVQLVFIKPKFEICVDHAHDPIQCFSRYAYHPSKSSYRDADDYIRVWKPMCEMESAATAVGESDSIVIEDLVVNFSQEQKECLKGSFVLPLSCIEKWAIEFNLPKCFLCIRKRGLPLTATLDHSVEVDPSDFTWVAHGVTCKMEDIKCSNDKAKKVDFYVKHLPMDNIPDCVFQKETEFTVELVPKLLPDIRKENAVINIASACDLVKKLALGHFIPKEATPYAIPRWQLMKKEPPKGLPKLNEIQCDAVEKALNNNFTLIQGPPGTGKTVVGVYIVYWFFELNSRTNRKIVDPIDSKKKEVILYCGPSNKSVDVVAEYLLRFGDALKPLRVYSQQVEMLDYPYPGCTLNFSPRSLRQECSKPELRSITLHHRIRENKENPHSEEIKAFDHRIKKGPELTDGEVKDYINVLSKARKYELKQHDIILCTCTAASTPSLKSTVSARQILIDESAMATEPQALIPLVCNNPEKIVLLGDHKQLRPIVKNVHVRKLGMSKSLFERYITLYKTRALMLDTQYRMHEDICKFPSEAYYEGHLKTMVERPSSVFLVDGKPKSVIFGDIRGDEISQVVRTAKGNENSKANLEERDIVVKFAKELVEKSRIEQQSIVILSPYNAQVSEIKDCLKEMDKITVTTITKSQGSEWRYVIISTVRSLPSVEIEREPDRAWLSKQVGFVGDPNQINVGITRAKEGLCIVGNQELLNCSPAWRQLLKHYTANNSVTKAENISVRRTRVAR